MGLIPGYGVSVLGSTQRILIILMLILSVFCPATTSQAADVSVAVAANFSAPMKVIARQFEQATGHHAVLSFGSSGKFYAQARNGAPYEVFLSADQAKAEALLVDGLA